MMAFGWFIVAGEYQIFYFIFLKKMWYLFYANACIQG